MHCGTHRGSGSSGWGQADWKFNFRIKQRQPSSLSLTRSLSAALYNNNNNNLLRSQRCESEEMRCNSKVRLRQMENKQQYCSIWRDGQLQEGEKATAVGGRGSSSSTGGRGGRSATLSHTVACMPRMWLQKYIRASVCALYVRVCHVCVCGKCVCVYEMCHVDSVEMSLMRRRNEFCQHRVAQSPQPQPTTYPSASVLSLHPLLSSPCTPLVHT